MAESTDGLRERARALRSEAMRLLEGPAGDVLRDAFGEVTVAGSVSLDLMAWRDIDLFVHLEAADAPRLLAVVPRFAAALAASDQPVSRIAYRDEHLEPDPAFPDVPGLYLGVMTAGGWKVDLWGWDAVRHPAQQERHRALASSLAHADRDLVLRLKDALWGRPDYRSMDVYDFVLAGAGDSLEDFERFRGRPEIEGH
ncbi:MAG TPA: hypothetical protein VLS51_09770 [Propionibacteriaceae bacterium]|nr:hypothetical protein [Propionibacteriaceae bacterium]